MEYSYEAVFNTFTDTTNSYSNDPPPIQIPNNSKQKKNRTKSKQKFTPQEDQIIAEQVKINGEKGWRHIAEHLPGRTARQCRERWVNYLSPNVSRAQWTKEEDDLLAKLVSENGTQWSKIATSFKLRTDVMLKNRWSYLKRRVTLPLPTAPVDTSRTAPLPLESQQPQQPQVQEEYQPSDFPIASYSEIWQANEECLDEFSYCDAFTWNQ